ncbi:putative disease resistance protein RGA3 [Salvia miltiorrhiza]|uniref:putative disease resistance protein RGA3 n=1 Tax=Salvia miltiorrhiza TaxID=226208 RepID=UPI0025ACF586|nr:putative disease resistance protein RGA3 [Salvia miltiorrhiza]
MDGGGVSAAAIEVLVQNVINVFKEERSLLRGLDGDAQQLQRTLGMIQAYLNDAEKKSITQDAVKIWLRELEAVAFDADNVVDELSYHLLHKRVNKMKTPKDKISPEERTFSTLAIVGMGGMGKTTLTRKIFNHQRVKNRFGSRVWVHVSQNFDPMLLFKKIDRCIKIMTLSSEPYSNKEGRSQKDNSH